MLATALSLVLCLAGASASAFSNDVAAAAGLRLAGQQAGTAVESELLHYLDDDDFIGAKAFVRELAEREEIDEAERRSLEDRIWRTKTERTLEYARKIREAIRNSDLDTMREYNARMQRLNAQPGTKPPLPATPGEEQVEDVDAESAQTELDNGKVNGLEPEDEASDTAEIDEQEQAALVDDRADLIADLVRRGEAAIVAYHLTIARPGTDSALGMVDELMALGDEGKPAAKGLGEKIQAVYQALIERDVARGRLDKAAIFAVRMGEVADRAGLPRDEADALAARIDQVTTGRREHDQLMLEATQRRNRGDLVTPLGEHALASAADALALGIDSEAARNLLDDVIYRQRTRADRMAKDGQLRDAAQELNRLGDALLEADIGEETLVADLRAKAAALYRSADIKDRERERTSATEARPEAESPAKEDKSSDPFTFINPF